MYTMVRVSKLSYMISIGKLSQALSTYSTTLPSDSQIELHQISYKILNQVVHSKHIDIYFTTFRNPYRSPMYHT